MISQKLMTPEQILPLVIKKWPLQGELKFIRRLANLVYEANLNGESVILRLTEPEHRSQTEIESELDWMEFLTRENVSLASPIRSLSNRTVEVIQGDQTYFAVLLKKAKGKPLTDPESLMDEHISMWGRYLGRMNHLTKSYQPQTPVISRQSWDQDATLNEARLSLDPKNSFAFETFHNVVNELHGLPKNSDSYGLVHCDLHVGNFFVYDQSLTAFDFDDSCYHWFSYDIVIPLLTLESCAKELKRENEMSHFKEVFLNAYLKENSLSNEWISRLNLFRNFRNIVIYHWLKTCISKGIIVEDRLPRINAHLDDLLQDLKNSRS